MQILTEIGEPLAIFKITHRFTTVLNYIVISKLFISWLLTVAYHPPTSFDIETEIQDNESPLFSNITGSLKITVVTQQNKSVSFISLFYH